MRIGITGASGFIGRHLIEKLRARGCDCVAFSRSPKHPVKGCAETRALSPDRKPDVTGLDAIINLAGESILGMWTEAKKQRILDSRILTTTRLVEAMKEARRDGDGPGVLISASATGFYGDRGEEELDEQKSSGSGFLAGATARWEAAAWAAESFGARVALVRIGFVMGDDGGSFPLMRTAFKLGLGGRLGSGKQWMSFVHVEDAAGLIVHLLEDEEAHGPFNAVCPQPVRNADFTRAVARALRRPAILPAPEFILKVLGELSRLLLDSQRVLPKRTLASGYEFRFPTLDAMLDVLNGSRKTD
jgi:uncharacterized protein (TIGR01777 family)